MQSLSNGLHARNASRAVRRLAVESCVCTVLVLSPYPVNAGEKAAHAPASNVSPAAIHSEAWWRARAVEFMEEIEDTDAQGRALHNFNSIRVRAGDIDGARAAAPRIANTQLRVFAHIRIAKYLRFRGDMDGCLKELNRARPVALADQGRYQMVDAYLDLADSLDLAIAYVSEIEEPHYRNFRFRYLAESLAQRGRLAEGLDIVNRYMTTRRQETLAAMAKASAKTSRIGQVEKLVGMLAAGRQKDTIWKEVVAQLVREKRSEEAAEFVDRMSHGVMRAQANALLKRVRGKPVADVSADELRKLIEAAPTREEKRVLQTTLLNKLLAENRAVDAERVIESMVATIQAHPREPEISKFGTGDDETAIAIARSNYLDAAKVYAKLGDVEASQDALAKGRQAVLDMPDASGLGKMMLVPKLVQAQSLLGDKDGVRETLRIVKPLYTHMISGPSAVLLIRNGEWQTGLEVAITVAESGRSRQEVGEIAAELIRVGQAESAQDLLSRVTDGPRDGDVFRKFGSVMITLGLGRELHTSLDELNPEASAHVCIGAAGSLASRVGRPPEAVAERAIVDFLTIPPDDLPDGFVVDRNHVPAEAALTANPGVYPRKMVATAIEHLTWHRRGPFVGVENAYRAVYRNEELGSDIVIEAFTLADTESTKRVQDEIHIPQFASRYFRKRRTLFFVTNRGPVAEEVRQSVQQYLERRKLNPGQRP